MAYKNVVFIHIAKTAGHTVQTALGLELYRYPHRARMFKNHGKVTFGHLDYNSLLERGIVSKEFDKSAFKFAFCRNPYDRAVSHFFYVKRRHPDLLPKRINFRKFTEIIGNYPKEFRRQHGYIDGIKLDYLGRYETFEEDLKKIAKTTGILLNGIPHKNTTNHRPYWHYYRGNAQENIYNYYKRDFEIFDYGQDDINVHRKQITR